MVAPLSDVSESCVLDSQSVERLTEELEFAEELSGRTEDELDASEELLLSWEELDFAELELATLELETLLEDFALLELSAEELERAEELLFAEEELLIACELLDFAELEDETLPEHAV